MAGFPRSCPELILSIFALSWCWRCPEVHCPSSISGTTANLVSKLSQSGLLSGVRVYFLWEGGAGAVPKVLPKTPDESGPPLEGAWRPRRRRRRGEDRAWTSKTSGKDHKEEVGAFCRLHLVQKCVIASRWSGRVGYRASFIRFFTGTKRVPQQRLEQ